MKKTIVIGLDGLEPRLVDAMLEAGKLPNLAELARRGGYSRVATTSPAQTPVASVHVRHGREPRRSRYLRLFHARPSDIPSRFRPQPLRARGRFFRPRAVNLRRGQPVLDLWVPPELGSTVALPMHLSAGIRLRARMLSGWGSPTCVADWARPPTTPRVTSVPGRARVRTLSGSHRDRPADRDLPYRPEESQGGGDLRLDVTLVPDVAGRRIIVRSAGSPKEVEIREGQWSDWVRVKLNWACSSRKRADWRCSTSSNLSQHWRCMRRRSIPDVETPLFPISHPSDYAVRLAEDIGGLYHTTGMVEDHAGLNNERISEDARPVRHGLGASARR